MNEETLVRKLAAACTAELDGDDLVEVLGGLEPDSALHNVDKVRRFVVEHCYADVLAALEPLTEPALLPIIQAFASSHINRHALKDAISAKFSDAALRRAARASLARLDETEGKS